MLAYLVLDAVARAAAVEVGMAHKKEFTLKSYKSCRELCISIKIGFHFSDSKKNFEQKIMMAT